MKIISIPLDIQPDGRVVYAGDFAKWRSANIVNGKLVGYYEGPLYLEDGTTKAFNWSESNELGQDQTEAMKSELTRAVQDHMDETAGTYGYDSIYTAATYADEPAVPQFQREGRALRAWRSLVWAHCHQVLADVLAGNRAAPSAADLIAELPEYTPPA